MIKAVLHLFPGSMSLVTCFWECSPRVGKTRVLKELLNSGDNASIYEFMMANHSWLRDSWVVFDNAVQACISGGYNAKPFTQSDYIACSVSRTKSRELCWVLLADMEESPTFFFDTPNFWSNVSFIDFYTLYKGISLDVDDSDNEDTVQLAHAIIVCYKDRTVELLAMWTLKAHQNKGWGMMLLQSIRNIVPTSLFLYSVPNAIQFYQKAGGNVTTQSKLIGGERCTMVEFDGPTNQNIQH